MANSLLKFMIFGAAINGEPLIEIMVFVSQIILHCRVVSVKMSSQSFGLSLCLLTSASGLGFPDASKQPNGTADVMFGSIIYCLKN